MSKHHPRQDNAACKIDPDLTGSGAEKEVVQAKVCLRIFWDGSIWRIFDHSDPNNPNHTAVDGTGVVYPAFQVRAMKIEGAGHWVKHDLIDNGMAWTREQYAVEVLHPIHVSAVWVDR